MAVISTGFMRQAVSTARALGVEHVWIAEYPGVIPNDSAVLLAEKVRDHVVPSLLEGFVTPIKRAADAVAEPMPRDVVLTGSLEAIQDHFDSQMWSDGLPIVPPTIERVEAFLRFTDRDPSEILGILLPEQREATVWNVAVNGVMAGCRPEYLPVLIAATEAMCDPGWRIEDAGSTPGWEPLVVLSGPLARTLDFNTDCGLMKVGRRSNATIGRFARLYMRNIAGLRNPPGDTDKGSIGFTFNVALAEDEAAIEAIGWDPLRVDHGFARDENVVTVRSVVAISPPIYSGGNTPLEHIETIAYQMATTCGPWSFTGVWYGRWHPLLLMSPSVATAFADAGWGKNEIRAYLFENLDIEARWIEHYPMHAAGADVPLAELVERGVAPALYAESDDPQRRVPILRKPEWTDIVVAGDPGRNQCKVYVNNHEQGAPVHKVVRLPDAWDQLIGGS